MGTPLLTGKRFSRLSYSHMEGLILFLWAVVWFQPSQTNPVALMIEDEPRPEPDAFVLAGNKNLRENIRHRADLLDLLLGWVRGGREDYHLYKRDPGPGYRRRGNVRYHRCYHNPVACF